jgi:hypothetical protein
MRVKDVERVIHREPFHPFRLLLDDGEELRVMKPCKSHVSGKYVALVGECRPLHGETQIDRFRIVPIKRVVSAENIPGTSK